LASTDNLTRTTKRQNTYKRQTNAKQKLALINGTENTQKTYAKITGQTEPGSVILYDIHVFQPWSLHRGSWTCAAWTLFSTDYSTGLNEEPLGSADEIFTGQMPLLSQNQQCQNTAGIIMLINYTLIMINF